MPSGKTNWWQGCYAGPVGVALGAWLAVLATLAPEGNGPGVTCDELYHALTAKRQVWALERYGLGFFRPAVVEEVFPFQADGPPPHPPLVHWIFGLVHRLVDPAPEELRVVSIVGARLGAALGYGLLVLLVGLWTARYEGPWAGTTAALACALMPRVFAHGHLAALEIWTALTLWAALWAAAEAEGRSAWKGLGRLGEKVFCRLEGVFWLGAGAVWGLTLLTRLHGVLLGPLVAGWLLGRRRQQALAPLAIWALGGILIFFFGWPWLWYATLDRLRLYLASGSHRLPIHVFYLGRVWQDWQTPWHYPWVIFFSTVPAGLLGLGLAGLWAKRRLWTQQPHGLLWIGLAVGGLTLFSWPGVPVYDGERLFLFVYPVWAAWVGVGCQWLRETLLRWIQKSLPRAAALKPAVRMGRWGKDAPDRVAAGVVLMLLLLQAVGLVLYHPCQLSYYNLLVGGLAGADRLGLEVNYWADAVREPLLAEAAAQAPGQKVLFAPHLAPFQAPGIAISSPALAESQTELIGWDPAVHGPLLGLDGPAPDPGQPQQAGPGESSTGPNGPTPSNSPPPQAPSANQPKHLPRPSSAGPGPLPAPSAKQPEHPIRWLIVYHRKADLADVEPLLAQATVVAEYRLRGVWLARLLQLPATSERGRSAVSPSGNAH